MDETERGFKLPHKDNIASDDVMRIRETIEKIDNDLSQQEQGQADLKGHFDRHAFEQFLNLWSTPYDNPF
ncbi:hypothetical protein AGMMS49949_09230 [Alphaproteobacteria bacterium]|nr:hypothetical protein AGMMS49949_09230 [Alphaproteobacteria bacterium]GHS99954.1 hypothetical protein AGMMS50296_8220 [Alphaproteobacteria bacterium]